MKTLIKCDFWIQTVILFACLFFALFDLWHGLTAFYFGLGGWQLITALAHLLLPQAQQSKGRKWYQITLLFVALVNGVAALLFNDLYMGVAFAMLFVGPVMAVWNMAISYSEGEKIRKHHTVWDVA